eukprot:Tbor_TRINITY_DN4327_c0_g1::TRINITY_DN4327_c0_g1_i1::g.7868::m.7868
MTFSPPVFITIGDEYEKRPPFSDKNKGLCFKVSGSRTGLDSLFQKKYLSLSEGDKYVSPGTYERRRLLEEQKTKFRPSDAPFRYSNPSKKGCSGSYFGTFSEKCPYKHEVEYAVQQPGQHPEMVKPVPRNFIVNNPKKGTYGYPGLSIANGDENKYISDPFDGEKRRNAMSAKESAKKVSGPPFKVGCRSGCFDETPHGVSKVYGLDRPLLPKKVKEEKKDLTLKNWVPGGRMCVDLSKCVYEEDPYEAKEKKIREERLRQKPLAAPWRPIGGIKSMPTRAIKFTPM